MIADRINARYGPLVCHVNGFSSRRTLATIESRKESEETMVRRFECLFVLTAMLFPPGLVNRKAVKFLISLASMFLPSWIDNTDYRV